MTTTLYRLLLLLSVLLAASCTDARSAPPPTPRTLVIAPSAATPAPGGPVYDGTLWVIGTSRDLLYYPVQATKGDMITGWTLKVWRDSYSSLGPRTTGQLQRVEGDQHVAIEQAATDGRQVLGEVLIAFKLEAPLQVTDQPIELAVAGDGVDGDRAGGVTVTVQSP